MTNLGRLLTVGGGGLAACRVGPSTSYELVQFVNPLSNSTSTLVANITEGTDRIVSIDVGGFSTVALSSEGVLYACGLFEELKEREHVWPLHAAKTMVDIAAMLTPIRLQSLRLIDFATSPAGYMIGRSGALYYVAMGSKYVA